MATFFETAMEVIGALDLGQVLMVVFTGVVAASTVVYAKLTSKLVSETRAMRKAQTEPRLSVQVELDENIRDGRMDLVIRNHGDGGAEDIRIGFKGDPTYFNDDRPIDQVSIIRNGLPYLGPRGTFRIFLGWLIGEAFTRAIQKPWTFDLTYKNSMGDTISVPFNIEFSQFDGLMYASGDPLKKVEKHLKSLRDDVRSMTKGTRPLHVVTEPREEYVERRQEQARQRKGDTSSAETRSSRREFIAKVEALGISTDTVETIDTHPEEGN